MIDMTKWDHPKRCREKQHKLFPFCPKHMLSYWLQVKRSHARHGKLKL